MDKLKEIIKACDKLIQTCNTHGSPLGDREVKETMFEAISKTSEEMKKIKRKCKHGGYTGLAGRN